MKFAQLLFSPTGGTRKVAEAITGPWEGVVETLDLTDPAVHSAVFQPEDLVLIAVPSYGGRVPPLAVQRLERMQGNGAGCVLVCVYGNRAYEDTLTELQDCAESRGFHVTAAVAAVAEHSILHQYAAGRPDRQDTEELKKFSLAVLEKYRQGKRELAAALPGNRPYKKAGGADLCRRPEAAVSAAASAQNNARPRRFHRMTFGKQTAENASPVCAALSSVLRGPGSPTEQWWLRRAWR